MPYHLDAGARIAAKNLSDGMDFLPGFWGWLARAHEDGNVFSGQKVGGEVPAADYDLSAWASGLGPGFFLRPHGGPGTGHTLGRGAGSRGLLRAQAGGL